jgi:uncharacterized membrane protein YuzA (DUF378 family)
MEDYMEYIDAVAYLFVVIGGLNWALGIADINLVAMTVGTVSEMAANAVYGLVGASGLYVGYDRYLSPSE